MKDSIARLAAMFLNVLLTAIAASSLAVAADLDWIRVADDGHSFIKRSSGKPFIAWGVNYDHDESGAGRLLEDYWETEWDKVEADFREIKELGANVVRIHLQFGKFMESADRASAKQLAQLSKLVRLAETTGLYLDVTGLGCYHKNDVPAWYDELDEAARWEAQARFWEAIAAHCQHSPAVFCYDLMNEPVVPGGMEDQPGWLVNFALGGKFFVQFITRQRQQRERPAVARQWIERLATAIRTCDKRHLITVGLIAESPAKPGQLCGFLPGEIGDRLDFYSVHIYPHSGKIDDALAMVKGFAIGKPVIVEEMFPLHCSADELGQFIDRSQDSAAGWIGFYWGKRPDEYRGSEKPADALTLKWLELFQAKRPLLSRAP